MNIFKKFFKALVKIFFPGASKPKNCDKYLKNHLITYDRAKRLYDEYEASRYKLLQEPLKEKYGQDFVDSKAGWFDINTVKCYIDHLDRVGKQMNEPVSGIYIYFGVYDGERTKDDKNQQTFFMVPTYKKGNEHRIFAVEGDMDEGEIRRMDIQEHNENLRQQRSQRSSNDSSTSMFVTGGSRVILNEAGLRPPPGPPDPMDS